MKGDLIAFLSPIQLYDTKCLYDVAIHKVKKVGGKMDDNGNLPYKPFMERLDTYIYVKNGYSVLTHLVPFSIAALLLLTLSVPSTNMLLKLATLLQKPNWAWLPAALLTAVTAFVYLITLNLQIRQGYPWSDHVLRRTIFTSLTYVTLCSLMAYAMLKSAPSGEITFGSIWACILISLLSLTGIGWKGPDSWVKLLDARYPNYSDFRLYSKKLSQVLQRVQSKTQGDRADVQDFYEAAKNLRASIEKNLVIEPKWARGNLQKASKALHTLVDEIDKHFPPDNADALMDFVAVCRCQKAVQYEQFVAALRTLGMYFGDLKCEDP